MKFTLKNLLLLDLFRHLGLIMNRCFVDLTEGELTVLWINLLKVRAQFSGLLFERRETLWRFIYLFLFLLVFWRFLNFNFMSPIHVIFKLGFTDESPSARLVWTDFAIFFGLLSLAFLFSDCALLRQKSLT